MFSPALVSQLITLFVSSII